MNLRVERLETSVHHFRETRIIRDIRNEYAAVSEPGRCSSCGKDLYIEILESFGEFNNPFLISDADKDPFDAFQMHCITLCVVRVRIHRLICCMWSILLLISGSVPMSGL